MNFLDIQTYWPTVSGAFGGFISQGGLKPIFTSLGHKWYAKYGYRYELESELKKLDNEYILDIRRKELENIKAFQTTIDNELSKISPQNLVEPIDYILTPALNESESYISDNTLREMFAKLIASSFDHEKHPRLHSSFTQIIKELSPLDAQNLDMITKQKGLSIANLILKGRIKGMDQVVYLDRINYLLLENNDTSNEIMSSSLINLERLGLIKIDFSSQFISIGNTTYKRFKQTPEYQRLEKQKTSLNSANKDVIADNITIDIGVVNLTEFGKNFTSVCL